MPDYNVRLEVMGALEPTVHTYIDKFLKIPETHWQPADLLPDSSSDAFLDQIREIRELSKELDDDFWIVLVGDTITEEALPTYESWIMSLDGIDQLQEGQGDNGWAKWTRAWTSEENRHGDALNKYLYLSGRIDMREVEISTQYLLADGFDIGTASDPYKTFVYTSFQELATFISHNNVARIAKSKGHSVLEKMNHVIARDEMRHHVAYAEFVKQIFSCDPSEMMLAYLHMMKHKIVMPAMHLRQSSGSQGDSFDNYAVAAQRIGVYTGFDYVDILRKLNNIWGLENIGGLTDEAEAARDYLVKLPDRMHRLAERIKIPDTRYDFKWLL